MFCKHRLYLFYVIFKFIVSIFYLFLTNISLKKYKHLVSLKYIFMISMGQIKSIVHNVLRYDMYTVSLYTIYYGC